MDANVAKIYYSPQGYWKGPAAIKKLAQAAKVSEDAAKKWLINQALWQIYLPAPKHIPCPKFDLSTLNALQQAGLLFLRWQPRTWSGSKLFILPDISKKLNRWPWKTLLWLRALFKKFTNEVLWNGHSCFRFTLWENITNVWQAHWDSPGPGNRWKI